MPLIGSEDKPQRPPLLRRVPRRLLPVRRRALLVVVAMLAVFAGVVTTAVVFVSKGSPPTRSRSLAEELAVPVGSLHERTHATLVLYSIGRQDHFTVLDVDAHHRRTIDFAPPRHDGDVIGPVVVRRDAIVVRGDSPWVVALGGGAPRSLGPGCWLRPSTRRNALWVATPCPWGIGPQQLGPVQLRQLDLDGSLVSRVVLPPGDLPLAVGRGRVIAVDVSGGRADGPIDVVDASTDRLLRRFTGYEAFAASPDVVLARRAGRLVDAIQVLDVRTGRVRQVAGPTLTPSSASISPNGRYAAVVANITSTATQGLILIDLRRMTARPVPGSLAFAALPSANTPAWSRDSSWLFFARQREGGVDTRRILAYRVGADRSSEIHAQKDFDGLAVM